MAFTVNDFQDLLRLLRQHPEWRDQLRDILLGDELLGLPATVARLAAALERLTEEVRLLTQRMEAVESRLERVEDRLDRVEGRLERVEETLAEHGERFDRIEGILGEHGQRLDRMEGTLVRQDAKLGDLSGYVLERRVRERAAAYIGSLLDRIRVQESQDLDDRFGDVLDRDQLFEVLLADVVLRGKLGRGADRPEIWLVVEISGVIDQDDVARAARRAAALRAANVTAIGVVSGESIGQAAATLAAEDRVVIRLDGRVEGWDEALAASGIAA
jgi:uncharacterized coiled-coil protein SlyX